MSEEVKETEATPIEVECPNCKHKFWHKIGHALGEAGEAVVEVAANVLQPGVSR